MSTAYLTLDEVNAHEAVRLGSCFGHDVYLLDLRRRSFVDAALLILDLDSLPRDVAARLLDELAPALKERLAVHTYHLTREALRRLVRSGVVVRRRLDRTLFSRLGIRRSVKTGA
jgi:hypothetical protein